MKDIKVKDNLLMVDGKEIALKYDIREYLETGNTIAVRLIVLGREDDINNIYGVIDGKIAWRIQDQVEYDKNCAPFQPDPYSGIDAYEKNPNVFIATSGRGFRYLVDPLTGKIVGEESWVK